MLVLTRKLGTSIQIGDGVRITIVSVSKQRVRLGIEASPQTRVLRQELHEKRHSAEPSYVEARKA